MKDHSRQVNKVSWHHSDEDIFFSASQDNTVKKWDIRMKKTVTTYNCKSEVRWVDMNKHNTHNFVVALDSGDIQVWVRDIPSIIRL